MSRQWKAKPINYKGEVFYDVASAARLLRTTAPKIQELMGSGQLDWTQARSNGKLLVSAKSIVALKKENFIK